MSREVVLDANVIVAWLDSADSLAARAQDLMTRLRGENAEIVLVDITVAEALSVLCRRAAQRRTSPPDLTKALETLRRWGEQGSIRWLAGEQEHLLPEILDTIATTAGRLNFNDALLVVLQREGTIGVVASFDTGFDCRSDFRPCHRPLAEQNAQTTRTMPRTSLEHRAKDIAVVSMVI